VPPVPARKVGGLILVGDLLNSPTTGSSVVYARVSSSEQRVDLDRQVARVTLWASAQKVSLDRVVTEVGSALSGERGTFLAHLRDPDVTTILVGHRDRLVRFEAEDVEAALSAHGRRLLVADLSEVDEDLVGEVTQILTTPFARLYGRGAAADRAARGIAALSQDRP
jgi:predicted site-specific integrase-resolvase